MAQSFNWKSAVGKYAPLLATALGGPLAGTATKFVAEALNIDGPEETLETKIEQRMQEASFEDLAALKTANLNFQVRMRELGIKEQDLYVGDTQNAREYFSNKWQPFAIFCILSAMVPVGGWYLVENMSTLKIEVIGLILPIYGQIVGKWIDSISYFVGTSKSSHDKTNIMSQSRMST